MGTKTDNHSPGAKLALRRHFLGRYHGDGQARVLDCCQGSARLWTVLRAEAPILSYWGMDVKPRKGRLKLDSVRYLAQAGWPENVIDIDTYGSPWKHWAALLPNVSGPVTVFLTIGAIMFRGAVDGAALDAMGLRLKSLRLPEAFCGKLSVFSLPYCLALASRHGLEITEATEALSDGNARYFGVRIQPRGKA